MTAAEASIPEHMTEQEFSDFVSCRFPYQKPERWRALIDRALSISTNAIFITLHEICRPPLGTSVLPEQQREMIAYWCERIDHPLVDPIMRCVEVMIDGRDMPVREVIETMSTISKYSDQYAALGIAYFSCNDVHGEMEPHYQKIIADWNAASA